MKKQSFFMELMGLVILFAIILVSFGSGIFVGLWWAQKFLL